MGAVRDVGSLDFIAANDDEAVRVAFGFPVVLDGVSYTCATIGNNGYLSFKDIAYGGLYSPYTPSYPPLPGGFPASLGEPIVYVFWADVDTRPWGGFTPGLVRYGPATVDGRQAWVLNWINVGYYFSNYDKLNSFQLIVYNNPGGYSFELNYDRILWETGDASHSSNWYSAHPWGFGEYSALMGVSIPNTIEYIKGWTTDGHSVPGSLLDSNTDTGLIHNSHLSDGVLGRYCFSSSTSGLQARSPSGSWEPTGTQAKPLKVSLPDGTWRTFTGGNGGTPLKAKLPDGTWRTVATTGRGGLWYVTADAGTSGAGPPGTVVNLLHARLGPPLSWGTSDGPQAQISADTIPALEFNHIISPVNYTQFGGDTRYPTLYREEHYAIDHDTEWWNNGVFHGFTAFMVMALPPLAVGPIVNNLEAEASIEFGFSGNRYGDPGGDSPVVRMWLTATDTGTWAVVSIDGSWQWRATSPDAAWFDFKFLQADHGSLTTGGMQLLEIRYAADDTNRCSIRIGGVDITPDQDELSGHRLPDFAPASIFCDAVGTNGQSTKIWEYKVHSSGLTGTALAAERAYFADKYGIPT